MLKEQSLYMVKFLFDEIYFSLQPVVLDEFETMWQLKKWVPGLSPCESELSPVVTYVESVIDIVTLGYVLFLSLWLSLVSYHLTIAPYSTIIRDWCNSPI
jgi:hypothetical protein